METNRRIGTGAQAEVFLSGDSAIKLFKPGYDKASVFYEATVTALIEQTGLPIAKVREVREMDGRLALRLEYIAGESLNGRIAEDPGHASDYLKQMVELQLAVFSRTAALPFSRKRTLKERIENNSHIAEADRESLLRRLTALPEGHQLCHGDFHGYNIILQGDKPYIIDWIDAASGCPEADVCRTYMLYSFYRPDLAQAYLQLYCAVTGKSQSAVLDWLPVVAAARLAEGNPGEEETIRGWMQKT